MTQAATLASLGSIATEPVGTAPGYMARAWVNFNGTGVVAIRASGNVTSITDNGTGEYTVNFTTAMSDANYSVTCSAARSDNAEPLIFGISGSAPTTTAVRVEANDNGGVLFDTLYGCVAIFR